MVLARGLVLQATGLKYVGKVACDIKEASARFLQAAYGLGKDTETCFFESVQAVAAGGGRCKLHQRVCALTGHKPDLVFVGAPCQPHSMMRDRRKVPPHMHKDFDVLFKDFFMYLDEFQPAGGVAEQVKGFLTSLPPGHTSDGTPFPKSWLHRFVHLLEQRGYVVSILGLDNDIWNGIPRERLSHATDGLRERVGSRGGQSCMFDSGVLRFTFREIALTRGGSAVLIISFDVSPPPLP